MQDLTKTRSKALHPRDNVQQVVIPLPARPSVSATEFDTAPLSPAAAAALDRLYRRIFGVQEAA